MGSVAQGDNRSVRERSPLTSDSDRTSSCVHVERPCRVDGNPVDERREDGCLADVTGPAIEEVAVQDDQVRRLPDLDRADDILEVVDPGTPRGVAGERVSKV